MVAGGNSAGSGKTGEIFVNEEWKLTSNIPIPSQHSKFDRHSAIVVYQKIFTIGGYYDSSQSYKVESSFVYNSIEWTKAEGLVKPKRDLRSIFISSYIHHVGGRSDNNAEAGLIESWKMKDYDFEKEVFDFQYTSGILNKPEVFAVPNDFC